MNPRVFVTGTGTGVGKTWVCRGIAAAAVREGRRVAALKPYETGCVPDALDALALARAAGRPDLADPEGFYRARPPLSPWAATLAGEVPPPTISDLGGEIEARSASATLTVIEGAGGLLVPVDEKNDVADLAVLLAAPLLLVARDGLGVLSHTMSAVESATRRGLDIAAVVLTPAGDHDASQAQNREILAARLDTPVLAFARCRDDDGALGEAAVACGVLSIVLGRS